MHKSLDTHLGIPENVWETTGTQFRVFGNDLNFLRFNNKLFVKLVPKDKIHSGTDRTVKSQNDHSIPGRW